MGGRLNAILKSIKMFMVMMILIMGIIAIAMVFVPEFINTYGGDWS
jgi:hypothetical protein